MEHLLRNRPTAEELTERNVLKPGGNLAAAKAQLARELSANHLDRELHHRPVQAELEHSHILERML